MSKRYAKKARISSEMALQITSMADIFTILLVFLLKSFSTGVTNITPSGNMVLPEAHKVDALVETLKVEISAIAVK